MCTWRISLILEERSPVWNQTCIFEVDEHTTNAKCVIIQVYDYDDVGNRKPLGECYVSWDGIGIGEEKVCTRVFNLNPCKKSWYRLMSSAGGEILVGLKALDFPSGKPTDRTA